MFSNLSRCDRGPQLSVALYLASFTPVLLLVAASPAASDPGLKDDAPAAAARTDRPAAVPAEDRLRADVSYLADDAREGRAPGTKGIEAAARLYRYGVPWRRAQACLGERTAIFSHSR